MIREELANVGKRVKIARKAMRAQQKEVAEALGVSPSHLSEIESGKANPSTDFHLKLSEKYNISVEYIFHGRGNIFYEDDGKITETAFDFKTDVDTIDKMIWLLRNSPYFKNMMLGHASKFIHQEEDVIKSSIAKHQDNYKT